VDNEVIQATHGRWYVIYGVGNQYADIFLTGRDGAVECLNYILGDGTRVIPNRAMLEMDLAKWAQEDGDAYLEALQF